MSQWNDEIWEAAEFIAEWDGEDNHGKLRFKFFNVNRVAIDEESDEDDAHMLIGLDSGGVRRVDILIDTTYGRETDLDDKETIEEAMGQAPTEIAEILSTYI